MTFKTYFLAGGAGFAGSHFIDALLSQKTTEKVTVYDNFSSGKEWHYQSHLADPRFSVIKGDIKEEKTLNEAMKHHELVMHFAANPDIARAAIEPGIDFTEGMYLTYRVLEAARLAQVKRILYTSGSGVYGEVGIESCEHQGNMHPISTYGASKLASEAFISSYCHMFGLTACVFRLANIVGPRQTHGVGYDFINKLIQDPTRLDILGDGSQSKSYIHINDVVSAVLLANNQLKVPYEVYNVATGDYISVLDIAHLTLECMNITQNIRFNFSGGNRGWKGDVPLVRLNTDKIRSLGWTCQHTSRQAIKSSLLAMIEERKARWPKIGLNLSAK
ncbi:NAD-dependent epimerase/dehydratase family protein [Legionella fairfieldensis]|uniref:NAD-dependent epimerase/dehydratase family protein n=1 Tax=Legionella fairfieldensis TaxID=45064 RepID=UPI00056A3182|nr:NAD-dependent epimerase/dehydratase family protein [Legionella fairfieldensis]